MDNNFDFGIWNEAKCISQVLTACKVANKSNKRLLRFCAFIFSLSCSNASVTSYLSENEAENLQKGDVQAQTKEREKCKNTSHHWPQCVKWFSRYSNSNQEFGKDGHHHYVGFQPHFHLNMMSQIQSCKTLKNWKCNTSWVFCLICLKFCRLLEVNKRISLDFKFCCHGNSDEID